MTKPPATSPDSEVKPEVSKEDAAAAIAEAARNKAQETPPETKPTEKADDFEEYDLELPKGSSLTQEDLNEIAEEAGRLGLGKEDAEKLLKMREGAYTKGLTSAQQKIQAAHEARKAELLSHPEFSGDKAESSWASVRRVLETFGSPKLVETLSNPETHGNNVELALLLKNLGDLMAPDKIPGKGGPLGGADSDKNISPSEKMGRALYPAFFEDKK